MQFCIPTFRTTVFQKEWVLWNQQSHLKCVRSIYEFTLDFICFLPWAVCARTPFESNSFKDMALNVGMNIRI